MNDAASTACPQATRLLVSVRSAAEADRALAGGASLIDIKEPNNGSLGRATDAVIAEIVQTVAGKHSVSAALGEGIEAQPLYPGRGLHYVKWGLAGLGSVIGWQRALKAAGEPLRRQDPECRPVAVAYADWRRANAPSPADVFAFACAEKWGAFLIDTWRKDGSNLLDWLDIPTLTELCQSARSHGVAIALAGSLRIEQIETVRKLSPNWIAVRGAACADGNRQGSIDTEAVRDLVTLLA